MDLPTLVSTVSITLACILIAVLAPLGRLDLPVPTQGRLAIPVMAGAVAVAGLPFAIAFLRRGSTKYLRLAPDGFEIAEGIRQQAGDWVNVVDVSNAAPEKPPVTVGSIVLLMSDGRVHSFAAGGCTPDGTALRDLVRYYWQRSEDRAELADGRAVKRLTDLVAR
jgi:hypothetical protein